jgi:hypothetical protein
VGNSGGSRRIDPRAVLDSLKQGARRRKICGLIALRNAPRCASEARTSQDTRSASIEVHPVFGRVVSARQIDFPSGFMRFVINKIEGIISTALQVSGDAESTPCGRAAPLPVHPAKRLPVR